MFYVALGYFVACLPYAILAKGLSSGIVPGVHTPVGGLVLLSAAAVTQQAVRRRLAEQFRLAEQLL